MAWSLSGSYAETCSCELMCPCNLSFDHGATYDYCRVTLVFNIREGEIDGVDVGGLKIAAVADTPKVMTEVTMAEAKRSRINAFGVEYEGKTGLSTAEFSWAA